MRLRASAAKQDGKSTKYSSNTTADFISEIVFQRIAAVAQSTAGVAFSFVPVASLRDAARTP